MHFSKPGYAVCLGKWCSLFLAVSDLGRSPHIMLDLFQSTTIWLFTKPVYAMPNQAAESASSLATACWLARLDTQGLCTQRRRNLCDRRSHSYPQSMLFVRSRQYTTSSAGENIERDWWHVLSPTVPPKACSEAEYEEEQNQREC